MCEHVFVPRLRNPADRERARELRRQGASLRTIAATVGAARSTVSQWVRDIPLSDEQQAQLDAANPVLNGRRIGQLKWSRLNREARSAAQQDGRARAQGGTPLHLAGCMLYWAEGSKHRNNVTFTNADPDMVAFFLRFLRECYGVLPEEVALTINCHLGNGLTLAEIEEWWLERLGLPETCLRAAAVNRPSSASKAVRRPLLYGTARLTVNSTTVVQSVYGAIQEYAGFDRPEWLDLGLPRSA
jgi:hypothetical protein